MPKRKGDDIDKDKRIREMFKEQRKDIDSEPYIKDVPNPKGNGENDPGRKR